MELDVKALGFVARALEQQVAAYEDRLARDGSTEDERSDATNDLYYVRALLSSIEQERRRLIRQP